MGDLHKVCIQLDEITLDYFSTLDEIFDTQANLEATLRNGFFHMAKARYTMGAKAVGAVQYHLNDLGEAAIKVKVGHLLDGKAVEFNVSREEDSKEKRDIPVDTKSNTVLRKRHVITGNAEKTDGFEENPNRVEEIDATLEPESVPLKATTTDPLKWFGILVPQSLRQSQTNFKNSVDLCCHLATLKHRLLHYKRNYMELLKAKEKLKAEESEADVNEAESLGVLQQDED